MIAEWLFLKRFWLVFGIKVASRENSLGTRYKFLLAGLT